MTYDDKLAGRIRKALGRKKGVTEKNMFGGLAFLLNGKMCCGVIKSDLAARIGPENYEKALSRPHVRPMDFTGRPIKGFVFVGPGGYKTDKAVGRWVNACVDYAESLMPRGTKK